MPRHYGDVLLRGLSDSWPHPRHPLPFAVLRLLPSSPFRRAKLAVQVDSDLAVLVRARSTGVAQFARANASE